MKDLKKCILKISTPEPNTGCWLWSGTWVRDNYGTYGNTRAHRLSWMVFKGPIPKGRSVCHRCDTPSCVNPDHLFIGTHTDNMIDASKKGRLNVKKPGLQGENHHSSKITNQEARDISDKYKAGGISQYALARQYGICQAHVCRIIKSKRYK